MIVNINKKNRYSVHTNQQVTLIVLLATYITKIFIAMFYPGIPGVIPIFSRDCISYPNIEPSDFCVNSWEIPTTMTHACQPPYSMDVVFISTN